MKLLGYAPDIDQTVEGVITDCSAFIPTEKGMQSAPSAQSTGVDALAAACYGAGAVRKLDSTTRVIAGTTTKLYELAGTTWTDVSRAVGGAYVLGSGNSWRLAQFGDTTLAVSKSDTLQYSSSGAFANVTGAPKASIVETVAGFVFLFDTNEASFGDSPNRWWCAAQNSYTDWTPSIATQCASGLLVSSPGRIYAAKRFGDQIVVYKERAMYIGTYVGTPQIWNFQQIPGEAGCNSQEAVVNIGSSENPIHLFMGADNFWRFDGARPVPIGEGVIKKTVYAEFDTAYAYRVKTVHDRLNSRVYFYYPKKGANGDINSCVVYHYRTNQWGRDDRTIESALEYISGGITWDTIPFSTWDTISSALSWDSSYWNAGSYSPAIFDTTHTLKSLDGTSTNSSFTTGDFGDDYNYYLLSRVKPRWLTKPTSATMTNFYKQSEGDSLTTGITTTMDRSRFDLLISSRWHRLQFNMVGNAVLNDIEAIYTQDGEE